MQRAGMNEQQRASGLPIGADIDIADVNRSTFKAVSPKRRYRSQCFEKALEFTLKNRNIVGLQLVHGTILKGIPIDHAWVELPGDVIFDPVDQEFYKGASYKTTLGSVAEARYKPSEAAKAALAGDT